MRVAVSDLGEYASDLKSVFVYQESNGASITPSKNYILGVVNFEAIKTEKNSIPDVNNIYTSVYTKAGVNISRHYNRGDGTLWGEKGVSGWHNVFIEEFENGGDGVALATVDASKAEYVEFDMYVSADMPAMTFWLSSNTSTDSGRAASTIPATKKGWNHISINMNSFNTAGGVWSTPYDTSALKSFIVHTTINPVDEAVSEVDIVFANMSFTKTYPNMNNVHVEPAWSYDSVFWTRTFENGGANDPVNANGSHLYAHLYDFNGGNAINAANAEFVELDIYCSAEITNESHSLWISSGNWADSGRRRTSISGLKKGWQHICLPISSFAGSGGEWSTVFTKDNIRTMFIESSFNAADETVTEITVKFANLAFTKSPSVKNTHKTIDVFEGVAHVRSLAAGENTFNASFMDIRSNPVNTTGAKYLEMDIFASEATDSAFHFWVADNRESSAARGRYTIPLLKKGWNHVVWAANDCYAANGYVLDGYNLQYPFLENTPFSAESNGGTIMIANIAATTDVYTVTWADADGAVLETDSVALGATPEYNGATPTKAPDGKCYYTFSGWDKEIVAVTGDVTYTATYDATLYVVGDANGDNTTDMLDIISIKKACLAEEYNFALDMNLDGKVDALDYTTLRKEIFDKF